MCSLQAGKGSPIGTNLQESRWNLLQRARISLEFVANGLLVPPAQSTLYAGRVAIKPSTPHVFKAPCTQSSGSPHEKGCPSPLLGQLLCTVPTFVYSPYFCTRLTGCTCRGEGKKSIVIVGRLVPLCQIERAHLSSTHSAKG